jgi:hypothetical protein
LGRLSAPTTNGAECIDTIHRRQPWANSSSGAATALRLWFKVPYAPADLIIAKHGYKVDTLERPIEISEYYSEKPPLADPATEPWTGYHDELRGFADCDRWARPICFLDDLSSRSGEVRRIDLNDKSFAIDDALMVWLQSAHWWLISNPLSSRWDQATLSRAPTVVGDMKLHNICVEFSALDLWDFDSPSWLVRAAWIVRDGDQYMAILFRQNRPRGTWHDTVHIVFDSDLQKFKLVMGDTSERLFLEALHSLFLVLDLIWHLVPGQTSKIEIPIEGREEPHVMIDRRLPIRFHKWGRYHVPYFENGIAYVPGLEFFEGD